MPEVTFLKYWDCNSYHILSNWQVACYSASYQLLPLITTMITDNLSSLKERIGEISSQQTYKPQVGNQDCGNSEDSVLFKTVLLGFCSDHRMQPAVCGESSEILPLNQLAMEWAEARPEMV